MNEQRDGQEVSAIVAEVEGEQEAVAAQPVSANDPRVDDLERHIRELEAAVGDLRTVTASAQSATAATSPSGRKTQVSYASRLLAKGAEPVAAGSVDAALDSLSVEQRIAVKAGLLRAGLL